MTLPTSPAPCPDPLCILDFKDHTICHTCPKRPKPKPPHSPRWGGKRPGAGAPAGNLNRLTTGRRSTILRRAVEKLAADPELRAFLLLIVRAGTQGELPESTRALIRQALMSREAKGRRAYKKYLARRAPTKAVQHA